MDSDGSVQAEPGAADVASPGGTAGDAAGDSVFRQAYHGWKKRSYWLLQTVLVLVWLPAAYFLLSDLYLFKVSYDVGEGLLGIAAWLQLIVPAWCMLLALPVATLAALSVGPGAAQDVAPAARSAYQLRRAWVRRLAWRWMAGLVLLPALAAQVCWLLPLYLSLTAITHFGASRYIVLLILLAVLALYGWAAAELIQYVVLRFPRLSPRARLAAVLAVAVVYAAVAFGASTVAPLQVENGSWVYTVLAGLWLIVLPLAAPLYMLFATRRPPAG